MNKILISIVFLVVVMVIGGSCNLKVGKDGTNCTVIQDAYGALITCQDGTSARVDKGPKGEVGQAGQNGMDAQPCTVSQGLNMFLITCPDGSYSTINNITPVKFCQDDTSGFPEYGFRIGDSVYATYWDASKGAFTAKLTPGNYRSTNGTGCLFTLNVDGSITQ